MKKTILKMVACILVLSLNLTVLQPLAVFAEQNISSVETMQEKWVPSEEDKRTVPLSLSCRFSLECFWKFATF